jgi:hypothetical protein
MINKMKKYFYIISCKNTTTVKIINKQTGSVIQEPIPLCPKYKFGITNNIDVRIEWLKKEFHVEDVEIIYLKKYKNARILENYIKDCICFYDKWANKKEWFGETESDKGNIYTLKEVLQDIECFNKQLT